MYVGRQRFGDVVPLGTDHEHGAGRITQHAFRHRPQHESCNASPPVGADDDRIGVQIDGELGDLARRIAYAKVRDDRRQPVTEAIQRYCYVMRQLLIQVIDIGKARDQDVVLAHGRAKRNHVHHVQRRIRLEPRELAGVSERRVSVFGEVDADDEHLFPRRRRSRFHARSPFIPAEHGLCHLDVAHGRGSPEDGAPRCHGVAVLHSGALCPERIAPLPLATNRERPIDSS